AEAGLLPRNPLRLGAAIQMAVLFTLVLWGLAAVGERFGSSGLLGTAALLGLTDLDALTYSMSKLAASGTAIETAVRALLIGLLANTIFKGVVAFALGAPAFRRLCAGGLAAFAVALATGLLLT